MYWISGPVGHISGHFSNPVPASVPPKTVPGTGYLSRIVLGPFWQLVCPANGCHIVNTLDVNKDKVV